MNPAISIFSIVLALFFILFFVAGVTSIFQNRRLHYLQVSLRRFIEDSGEKLLLGPVIGFYESVSAVMALTSERLYFRTIKGKEIKVDLREIADISEIVHSKATITRVVILTLIDGTKHSFRNREPVVWMQELQARTGLSDINKSNL
jgi:hypothetical protein